jgi:YD repeat-containing protein
MGIKISALTSLVTIAGTDTFPVVQSGVTKKCVLSKLYYVGGTDVSVADGGTGRSSSTAYALITGGGTSVLAQQSVTQPSGTNYLLKYLGTASLPAWETTLTDDGITLTKTTTGGSQFKSAYDGSNYTTVTTDANGNTTATLNGTSSVFTIQPVISGSYLGLSTSVGKFRLFGTGGTNNEDLILDLETNANVAGLSSLSGVTQLISTGIDFVAPYFQTSTAITANSSGTVAIVAKDANTATNNAGWLPLKDSSGNIIYVPYWS